MATVVVAPNPTPIPFSSAITFPKPLEEITAVEALLEKEVRKGEEEGREGEGEGEVEREEEEAREREGRKGKRRKGNKNLANREVEFRV
jgi:hypothetical protein